MPRHRLLADGAAAFGAGASASGAPEWPVRCGSRVSLVLDATGWLGAGTLATAAWTADDVALSGTASTATEARCLAFVPEGREGATFPVTATLTSSAGPVRVVRMLLRAI